MVIIILGKPDTNTVLKYASIIQYHENISWLHSPKRASFPQEAMVKQKLKSPQVLIREARKGFPPTAVAGPDTPAPPGTCWPGLLSSWETQHQVCSE